MRGLQEDWENPLPLVMASVDALDPFSLRTPSGIPICRYISQSSAGPMGTGSRVTRYRQARGTLVGYVYGVHISAQSR